MSNYTMGFIGTGNMGGALAAAAAKSGCKIALCDRSEAAVEALAKETGGAREDITSLAASSKYIFLGVKPQVLPGMLREIAPVLKNRSDRFILVSMAAGVSIAKILSILEADYPVIRIMPNTPCRVGKGMILYAPGEGVSREEAEEFAALMSHAGLLDELPEAMIDAGCAISGCGPAFAYMFIDALADGGVRAGLTKKQAVKYACQTVLGSAEMVMSTGRSPGELKDAVCSPAGSTIEGVKALEDGCFRADVMSAVEAALRRTQELGK